MVLFTFALISAIDVSQDNQNLKLQILEHSVFE